MATDTALLVIDVQQGMFDEGIYEGERLVANLKSLIASARASDIPVIYVQHSANNPADSLHPDQTGFAIYPAITPLATDSIVQKHEPDSFQGTNLEAVLTEKGIKRLVVAGIQTELCVDTTCRAAYSKGYEVTLVGDAHSTFNSSFLMAADIIKHHNVALGGWFAKVKPTAEVTFEA